MRLHAYEKTTLNARILASQRNKIDELLKQVNEEYGTKLTVSDIVREVIEAGLPIANETKAKWILEYL
mgnify:CR=1 FL=1|jgi:5'-deoxynucleotidase YfbR-like HD superfamily hydrolase